MPEFLRHLFSTDGFPPRWQCGDWSDVHGWVHVCSDVAIFGAYAAIPVVLVYFILKRKNLPFPPIFWLFGAFIFSCGIGHLIEATIFWHPWYRLSGAMKVVTAIVSWATVFALIRAMPKALHLPGLAEVNAELLREIEEKKTAEAALRRLEAFESAVLGASLDAIITMDQSGKVVEWNKAAERIFGYSADAAVGREMAGLIIPERLGAAHRAGLVRHLATGHDAVMRRLIELPARRADGTEILTEVFITRIDSDGTPLFTGFLRDITERKKIETEREAALEHVRLVVEAAPNAMLMADSHGRITLVNSQVERLFGYAREDLLNQPVEMLVPERYRAAHPGHRGDFFHTPSARPMGAGRDLFGRRKDGTEVPIEIGLNPVRTGEGAFVLASIIDITERKRFEAQQQAALEQSEMLLREIHHRVKNNMQVISSLLSLHSEKLHDPVQKGVFAECRNRIRAMALIHERLYGTGQFARLEFGDYLAEMTRMILGSSAEIGTRVRLDLQRDRLELVPDTAIPLGLIASELMINAMKHGFAGGRSGVLTVRLRAGEEMHELTVQDDGPGMPPDFSPEQSAGIGIDLVESLTRQIGGQREIQTGPAGTSVTIRWPAGHRPPEQTGSTPNP